MTQTVTLTTKESSLLKDLRAQEQICVEKYARYASESRDGQLKNLFSQIEQTERQHVQTLDQISAGNIPQTNSAGGTQNQSQPTPNALSQQDKNSDAYLCQDALSTEKHVSSTYNTCIFEFKDTNIRNSLNHIQKEEQQHGKQIYDYMSVNGMYC